MGVVNKLKRLHKQNELKPMDIGRVRASYDAGVDNEEYLFRARTLQDYIGPIKEDPKSAMVEQSVDSAKETKSQAKSTTSKKTKPFKL